MNLAFCSIRSEHVACSFITDFSDLFKFQIERPNLHTIALTSKLLVPDESPTKIEAMLQVAAKMAMKMPQLETMEIWNGERGLAALFSYQANREKREAVITWRATWELSMAPAVIRSWEAVAQKQGALRFSRVHDELEEDMIKCVGDAIHYLKLSSEVIRPVSLWQIRNEQRALEGGHSE